MTRSDNAMEYVSLPNAEDVAIVSCDLLGHSNTHGVEQVRRVTAINEIVSMTIRRCRPEHVVWASGGDGGHVVFRGDQWQGSAIRLVWDLRSWAHTERVKLRVTGHVGRVASIWGADGRVQVVGSGINFAGWLLRQFNSDAVVVSDTFRRGTATAHVKIAVSFHDERIFFDRHSAPQPLYLMSFGEIRSTWSEDEFRIGITS